MTAVSPDAGASTARRTGLLELRSRGQAPHPTTRARARFQACAAAGLAARPCHRGENVGALQCGRAPAFSFCGWQTGLRRLVSELRVPLPDGALRAKKWNRDRGADYAVWRALQDAADHGEELRLQMAEQTSSDVSWVQTKSAGCRNLLDSPG